MTELITPEEKPSKPNVVWIAGALGTRQGGKVIEGSFVDGVDYNPSILSSDKTSQDRYEKLAEKFISNSKNGERTVFAVHSFGVQELYQVIEQIEKVGNEYLKNLEIILVAPFGLLKGLSQIHRMLRVIKLASMMMPLGTFSDFRYGIESLNYLPPENIGASELEARLREFFSKESQFTEKFNEKEVPQFSSIKFGEDYFSSLGKEQQQSIKEKLIEIDKRLIKVIDRKNNKLTKLMLKHILRQRAKLLSEEMSEAFAGGEENPEQSMIEMYQVMAQMQLGLSSLFEKALKGKVVDKLREVKEKGGTIKCIIPEYDVIYSLSEFMDLIGVDEDEALDLIAVLTGTTHASFSMNATGLQKAISELI